MSRALCHRLGTDAGHRGLDPMGTRCPLHPISSSSHGAFSPEKLEGTARRSRVTERIINV